MTLRAPNSSNTHMKLFHARSARCIFNQNRGLKLYSGMRDLGILNMNKSLLSLALFVLSLSCWAVDDSIIFTIEVTKNETKLNGKVIKDLQEELIRIKKCTSINLLVDKNLEHKKVVEIYGMTTEVNC